jgi:LysR family nod box-dependent transcriptional activator
MHFRHLDLNLLVALDALLTERNITRAGKRVFLTQSAMSGALARLREYFGDELLVQVGRKMVLTPLGESLAAPVRGILMDVQKTLQYRPTFDPATSTRKFTVMMSDFVSTVLMPDVLKHIADQAPHVQFELVWNDVEVPQEVIERGDVDMLIMPQQFLAKDHPTEPLFEDEYVCIVSADHPEIGQQLTTEQYLSLGHVVVRFNRGRNPSVDEYVVDRLGLERRIEVVTMTFSAIPQFVAGTRRIATVQRRLAEQVARYLPLKILPAPIELPRLEEAMQWHSQFADDPAMAWLRGSMRAAADALRTSRSENPRTPASAPRAYSSRTDHTSPRAPATAARRR